MTGMTHQMIALLTAFWLLTIYPLSAGPIVGTLMIVAVMMGALTPDLDQRNLKIPPGPGILRVTTGSLVELIIVRGGIVIAVLLLLQRYWGRVTTLFR